MRLSRPNEKLASLVPAGLSWEKRTGLVLVLTIAAAVQGIVLATAGGPSPDGLRYIALAQEIHELGLLPALKRQGSEPIFPVLVAGAYSVLRTFVGDYRVLWLWSVQLVAAAGMVAATMMVYLLTRKWLGAGVAPLAALFFCLLPEGARLGADGIADGVCLAFVATGLYCWFRACPDSLTQKPSTHRTSGESVLHWPPAFPVGPNRGPIDYLSVPGDQSEPLALQPSASRLFANSTWIFGAGFVGALAAMAHRGALTFLAFSGLFLGWRVIRGLLLFARSSSKSTTGWKNGRFTRNLPTSLWATGSAEEFELRCARGGSHSAGMSFLGGLAAFGVWAVGVLTAYGPYWILLGHTSPRSFLNSAVSDVLALAPYPNWPKERGAIPAGTHVGPLEETSSLPVPGESAPAAPAEDLLRCQPEKLVLQHMFLHREVDIRTGVQKVIFAGTLFGQELADAFGYFLGIPALLGGIFLWWPRTIAESFARGFVVFHLITCLWWTYDHGYIAARHLLPVAILGVGAAAWLCYGPSRLMSGTSKMLAWVILLVLGLDAVNAKANTQAMVFKEAGCFLRDLGLPKGWVADEFGYTGFWMDAPNIAIDDLWAYLEEDRLQYIVVRRSLLEGNSWRGELLRTLLGSAGQELAVFSTASSKWGLPKTIPSPRAVLQRLFRRCKGSKTCMAVVYRWDSKRWKEVKTKTIFHLAKAASARGITFQGLDLWANIPSHEREPRLISEKVIPGARIPQQPGFGSESLPASFRR